MAGIAAFLDAAVASNEILALSALTNLVLAILPIAFAIASMALVYRFVPESRPSWRATWAPALVVGLLLTISARAFVFLAPRLIGAAATIGALATLFAALAWLGLSFQAILIGAAWVGERHEGRGFFRSPEGTPSPPDVANRASPRDPMTRSGLGRPAAPTEPSVRRERRPAVAAGLDGGDRDLASTTGCRIWRFEAAHIASVVLRAISAASGRPRESRRRQAGTRRPARAGRPLGCRRGRRFLRGPAGRRRPSRLRRRHV